MILLDNYKTVLLKNIKSVHCNSDSFSYNELM